MNNLTITGNLTKDPELSETSGGIFICRFNVAVNRKVNGENKADYYRVTAWRGLGENVAKYCKKGSKVLISGKIELNSYTDKDGIVHPTVDVTANEVEFLSSNKKDDDDGETRYQSGSRKSKPQLQDYDDDDLPPF